MTGLSHLEPLSQGQIENVHRDVLRILTKVGIKVVEPASHQFFREAGA